MTDSYEHLKRKASIDAREDKLRKRTTSLALAKRKLKVKFREVEVEKRELELQAGIENLNRQEEINAKNDEIIGWTTYKRGLLNEPSRRETELQKNGDINALQRYRRDRYFYELELRGGCYPLEDFLETERQLRETAQKKMRLGDQSGQNKQDLGDLHKRYWDLERQWGEIRSTFPDGPLTRAFDFWRSHPTWYMHRVLREDCAARGGCCSRECECCLTRSHISAHAHAAGHCTAECGCCRETKVPGLSEIKEVGLRDALSGDETKGLPMEFSVPREGGESNEPQHVLSEEEKMSVIRDHLHNYNDYESSEAETEAGTEAEFTDGEEYTDGERSFEDDHYYSPIVQASIFGLMISNSENPLLVDKTPPYGQTNASTGETDVRVAHASGLVAHDADSTMTDTD
ncbi:hypothetical protein N7461_001769 [Penicillium sp. DV-2018c]|nr:hypothetical protein N7461_001769 [Penicillium sp. DV-2018c]